MVGLGLVGLLAACGGGGPAAVLPSPPLDTLASKVTVQNVRVRAVPSGQPVTRYALDVFQGSGIRGGEIEVMVDFGGEVAVLAGRTVYWVVSDPDALFRVSMTLSGGTTDHRINLQPQAIDQTVGRRQGDVLVRLCLDTACTAPLSGASVVLPYDINVRDTYRLESEGTLQLKAPYAQAGNELTGRVLLPEAAERPSMSVNLRRVEGQALFFSNDPVIRLTTAADGQSFALRGEALRPGTYEAVLSVSGEAVLQGQRANIQKQFPIELKVAMPDDGRPLLQPQAIFLTGSYGQDSWPPFAINFTGNTWAQVSFWPLDARRYLVSRFVYLDAQGQPISPACEWLRGSVGSYEVTSGPLVREHQVQLSANACIQTQTRAVPPGRYWARVYLKPEGGEEIPEYLAVTLDVAPS